MTTNAHGNDTVTPIAPSSPRSNANKTPNIKRNVPLYRYGKNSLLGRKGWKDGSIIVYDDSTLKIFKDIDGHRKLVKPIQLEEVILDTAFGKATSKYGPPPIVGDEHNFISSENFIAMPETKERKKIHWFAARDEHNLKEIMQVLAEAVAGKVRPPTLGKGPFGRYFNQDENEKWLIYWRAQQRAAETQAEENGEHKHATASPGSAKPSSPIASLKPAKDQPTSHVISQLEMPSAVHSLRLQRDNLCDEAPCTEIPIVRLVGGRRVKESVAKADYQIIQPTSSTPIIVPINQQGTNGRDAGPPVYKSEISTFVTGEPETTTTNITITVPPGKEQFSQHQEREEIITENQKTVINVGSAERTVSNVDDSDNGVTYTTTKQSSYHRSTVTTSTE